MFKFRDLEKILYIFRFLIKVKGRNIFTLGFVKLQHNVKIIVEPSGKLIFGKNCVIKHDTVIFVKAGAKLFIGNNFSSGHHTEITVGEYVEIGDDVIMAPYTYISDASHVYGDLDKPIREQGMKHSPIKIGSNVWMGRSSMILQGAEVQNNTVIAAGAILTKKVEKGSVVLAGVPARVIKNI